MADKRVKYIADDGPFCEVGITGKQTSWRRNQSGFVTEENAALLIASGKFVLSSTAFATDADGLDSHLSQHAAIGIPFLFPGFRPSILPSLVASSTAAQTGTTVTVTATSHGLPAAVFDGWRVWFPGSPTILAGWYDGFAYVDANSFTFSNPISQTVGSESVNGGLTVTSLVEFCAETLRGGALGPNGRAELRTIQHGGSSSNKVLRMYLGGVMICNPAPVVTLTSISSTTSFSNVNSQSKQRSSGARDATGVSGASIISTTVDTSVDQLISVRGSVSAGGDYIAVQNALLFVSYQP